MDITVWLLKGSFVLNPPSSALTNQPSQGIIPVLQNAGQTRIHSTYHSL